MKKLVVIKYKNDFKSVNGNKFIIVRIKNYNKNKRTKKNKL